jgi:hypothetical protein
MILFTRTAPGLRFGYPSSTSPQSVFLAWVIVATIANVKP